MTTATASPTGTLVVVGSLNLDLGVHTPRLPGPGETVTGSELRFSPGGKSSNQAAAAALLGGAVHLVGAVGDDPFGDRVLAAAAAHGVHLGAVERIVGGSTGTALIAVDARGENNIIVSPGANAALTPAHLEAVPESLWAEAGVLCLALEVPVDVVIAAARRARETTTLVVLNPSPLENLTPELLPLTDVLVVNEHELAGLLGAPVDAVGNGAVVLDQLLALGVSRCVVTLGGAGAVVLQHGAAEPVVAVAAIAVDAVDTTGCGDAFTGALAYALARGADLIAATRLGTRVGAFAAQSPGAQVSYPDAAALERFSTEAAPLTPAQELI